MASIQLRYLLALLKIYRAALTWSLSVGRGRQDHDVYRRNVDAVIRDVRFALENGGFYRAEEKQLRDAA